MNAETLLISALVDNSHLNPPYQGFYNVIKRPDYYGTTQFTCSAGIFNDYAYLINDYDCDMLNIIGTGCESFRFNYQQIPNKQRICNVSLFSENMGSIDSGWDLQDLSHFSSLKSLSILSLEYLKHIDCSSLKKLERLVCPYRAGMMGVNSLRALAVLKLSGYKEQELTALADNYSLKKLALINTGIRSLAGIESLENLQTLFIDKARSLNDVTNVVEMKNLQQLWFGSQIKNTDWSFLKEMKQLKALHVERTEDLSFLNDLPELQFFSVTKVLKGNDEPLRQHARLNTRQQGPFPFAI